LTNYGAGGMTADRMAEDFKALLPELNTEAEIGVVVSALHVLSNYSKHAEAVSLAQAAQQKPGLKNEQRQNLALAEFKSLAALKRENEFVEKHRAEYFSEMSTAEEKHVAHFVNALLETYHSPDKLDDAVARVATFVKQFPQSNALAAIHSHIPGLVSQMKKDEREKQIESLAKTYSNDV